MDTVTQPLAQVLLLASLLLLIQWPLGNHIANIISSQRHLTVERFIYRLGGVDPTRVQTWRGYLLSVLGFSLVGIVGLLLLLRLQPALPASGDKPAVPVVGAVNTAVSFVTNTNWQWYSGEETLGSLVQMMGLTVQNFLSAAVGISVAYVLIRGFTSSNTAEVGNFWVDLTRSVIRLLLPLAAVAAVLLMLGGVIQNLNDPVTVTTLAGGEQTIPGGPVATQEAIKVLGTNGGGFFNANSAHPFENPNGWTNLLQVLLMLVIPFSMPRALGLCLGNVRQGAAILGAMAILWAGSVALTTWAEIAGDGAAPQLAGAAMEGKELRFGEATSALYAASTTATSAGAVNASHDSLTAAGGGVALTNMMLGEVSLGGVGPGLYGMLVLAVLSVFLAGLMIGRTPELYGKTVGRTQMTFVALFVISTPALVLLGSAVTVVIPALREASVTQAGPHGLTGVLYAYASAVNNNGSAFASFESATDYQNVALAIAMLVGRFVPIALVLALAGSFVREPHRAPGPGTLRTDTPLFVGLLVAVVIFIAGLTYVPALALGPIAEALQ